MRRTSNECSAHSRSIFGVMSDDLLSLFAKDVHQTFVHPIGETRVFLSKE
jgi:hypothetical protein